jgi:hypothetical protein
VPAQSSVDLEDAVELGQIDIEALYELFGPIVGQAEIDTARAMDPARSIQMLRSRVIKALINACVEIYADIAEEIDTGTLKKNAFGGGLVGYCRHAEAVERIRTFSRENIYKSRATQDARKIFGHAMKTALEGLCEQLIAALENGGAVDPASQVELSRLPGCRFGARVPTDPDAAFPWLLDQITLLSDRQVLEISRRVDG